MEVILESNLLRFHVWDPDKKNVITNKNLLKTSSFKRD